MINCKTYLWLSSSNYSNWNLLRQNWSRNSAINVKHFPSSTCSWSHPCQAQHWRNINWIPTNSLESFWSNINEWRNLFDVHWRSLHIYLFQIMKLWGILLPITHVTDGEGWTERVQQTCQFFTLFVIVQAVKIDKIDMSCVYFTLTCLPIFIPFLCFLCEKYVHIL